MPGPSAARLKCARSRVYCGGDEELTPKQRVVLQLAWEGHSVKESALVLGLSDKTVKNYRSMIYEKFGVGNVEGMLREGVLRGLIHVWSCRTPSLARLAEWPGSVEWRGGR